MTSKSFRNEFRMLPYGLASLGTAKSGFHFHSGFGSLMRGLSLVIFPLTNVQRMHLYDKNL